MTKKKILICLLTFLGAFRCLSAELQIFGYYQNRFFLLGRKDIGWKNLNDKIRLGDYNRLRFQMSSQTADIISTHIAVDFFTFHGIISSPLGVYGKSGQSGGEGFLTNLDRAYIDLYLPGIDITLGKQRVAFGVSRLWAPLDLFNRINIFEPGEEKPGVSAIKMYIPIGLSSSLTAVFAPEDRFHTSKTGLRFKTQKGGVDIGLSLIRNGPVDENIFGLDLRGENVIGWWIEGGYFASPGKDRKKLVLGVDYTFPLGNGLYWMSEFYYDQSGEGNASRYDYSLLQEGQRFTLGKTYMMSSLNLPLNQFLSSSFVYIGNWSDGSFFLGPGIRYDIAEDVMMSAGFFFPTGKKGGEFNRNESSNILFVWLSINF